MLMKQANQKESSKTEKTRNRSRYDESDDSDGGFKRRATSLRRGRVITKGSDMQKFFSKSDNSESQSTSNTRKLIRGWSCDRKVSNAERFEPSVPLPLPNETHRAKFEYINGTSQGYKHKLSAWNSARKPQVTEIKSVFNLSYCFHVKIAVSLISVRKSLLDTSELQDLRSSMLDSVVDSRSAPVQKPSAALLLDMSELHSYLHSDDPGQKQLVHCTVGIASSRMEVMLQVYTSELQDLRSSMLDSVVDSRSAPVQKPSAALLFDMSELHSYFHSDDPGHMSDQ
ncbi:hypothetical protein QYM36_004063 [Artemia franciscana]|uniref:Uncharacterized protein n=1 Tax=Artemia franciscana TaxID=6661 RepID=A0AA88I4I4_ARTSF|nr:hypothetical protein QYM36_004063 [Artemia franciscana]